MCKSASEWWHQFESRHDLLHEQKKKIGFLGEKAGVNLVGCTFNFPSFKLIISTTGMNMGRFWYMFQVCGWRYLKEGGNLLNSSVGCFFSLISLILCDSKNVWKPNIFVEKNLENVGRVDKNDGWFVRLPFWSIWNFEQIKDFHVEITFTWKQNMCSGQWFLIREMTYDAHKHQQWQ